MMTLCSSCAAEIPADSPSCPNCGTAEGTPPPPLEPVSPLPEAAPEPAPMFNPPNDLEGLSGWLILVGIGLVISPFRILYSTLAVTLPVLIGKKYQPFLSAHPAVAGVLGFEIITNIILIAAVLALLFLFFKRKRAFPTYMILFMATQLLVAIADAVAVHASLPNAKLTTAYTAIARSVVVSLIWIPYFLVSRRVKATFVR